MGTTTVESFIISSGNVRLVASIVHQQPTFQFRLALQHPIHSAIDHSSGSAQPCSCRGRLVCHGGRGTPATDTLFQPSSAIHGHTFASVWGSPFLPRIGSGSAAGLSHQFSVPTISGTCVKTDNQYCTHLCIGPGTHVTFAFVSTRRAG